MTSFLRSPRALSSLSSRTAVLLASSFCPGFGYGCGALTNSPSLLSALPAPPHPRPRARSSSSSISSYGLYSGALGSRARRRSFSIEARSCSGRSLSSGDVGARSFSGRSLSDERWRGRGGWISREKPSVPGLPRPCSSTAAGSSALPSRGPDNWLAVLWANFLEVTERFGSRLQGIRLGWLDLLTMLRIVLLAAGAVGVWVVSKRAWQKIREHADGKSGGEGAGDGGPMQVLARGATTLQSNMGPWSVSDMTMGLTAIAKVTQKVPPPLPGQDVKELTQDGSFLLRAQHWRSLAEAAYAPDPGSFSLFSNLPESSIVGAAWEPDQESFRPAYTVFVDPPYGAVVLAVRGTSHIVDMLLNSGTSPEPFGGGGGYAHGGFVHATEMLHKEVLPHIEKAFKDRGGMQKDLQLVIVGHSLGAAVGTLTGLKLREKFPDLQCWAFCPPACMSLDLAKECKSFTTSFAQFYDIVPRFSLQSVEKLRSKIQEFDWDEVERVAKDDEDWQNIKTAMDTFRGLKQAKSAAVAKLPDTGVANSEPVQKVKELGQQALNSDTGKQVIGLVKDLGGRVNGVIEGTDGSQGEESKGQDGDGKESEGECRPPPLYPPGKLLIVGCDPAGFGKVPEQRSDVSSQRNYGATPTFDDANNVTWRMVEADQEDLDEIVVSPWLVSDHMLGHMCEAIGYFQSRCPPVVK